MKHETGEQAPPLTVAEAFMTAGTNAVAFLEIFHNMRLNRWRANIAFDHESLAWIVKAWDHAAMASVGNKGLREACLHERDRYKHLYAMLKDGEGVTGQFGMVYLDKPSDWPSPVVIKKAIAAMRHAEIRVVH